MITRTITAGTHGRYLIEPPSARLMAFIVGTHGYAESAEVHLGRLTSLPGAAGYLVVSVQGLNRFYRGRSQDVIASWMTRQDRELAIADNVAYLTAVVDAVAREWDTGTVPLVFAGFSQGVAMAFRAACASPQREAAVIALGSDVPPELGPQTLSAVRHVLLGRGGRDEWYTEAKTKADLVRLTAAGVQVTPFTFDAGHEWTDAFSREADGFVRRLSP